MSDQTRSEQACPVCLAHTLALDEPPRIDVMGVQPYSDLIGMGDVRPGGVFGIVCLTCGTRWRDREAFDRGEPEPAEVDAEAEASEEDDGSGGDDAPGRAGPDEQAGG